MLQSGERRVIRAAVQEKIVEIKQDCDKKSEVRQMQLKNVKQQLLAMLNNENEDEDTQVDTQEPQENSQEINVSQENSNEQQNQLSQRQNQSKVSEKEEIRISNQNQQLEQEDPSEDQSQNEHTDQILKQEQVNQEISLCISPQSKHEEQQENEQKQVFQMAQNYEESPAIKQSERKSELEQNRDSVVVHNSQEDMQSYLTDQIFQQVQGLIVEQEKSGFLQFNLEQAVKQPRKLNIQFENQEEEEQEEEDEEEKEVSVEQIEEVSEEDYESEEEENQWVTSSLGNKKNSQMNQLTKLIQEKSQKEEQIITKNESQKQYNLFDTRTIKKLEESGKCFDKFHDEKEESYSEQMNDLLQKQFEDQIQLDIENQDENIDQYQYDQEQEVNQFRNTSSKFYKVREDIEEYDSEEEYDSQGEGEEKQNLATFEKFNYKLFQENNENQQNQKENQKQEEKIIQKEVKKEAKNTEKQQQNNEKQNNHVNFREQQNNEKQNKEKNFNEKYNNEKFFNEKQSKEKLNNQNTKKEKQQKDQPFKAKSNEHVEKIDNYEEILKQEQRVTPKAQEEEKVVLKKPSIQNAIRNQQQETIIAKAPKRPSSQGFKKLTNQKIIKNALTQVCLAGEANKKRRLETLLWIDQHEQFTNFIILFKNSTGRHDFWALYNQETEGVIKIHGSNNAPETLDAEMVQNFYRYDSGAKEFKVIAQCKHFTTTTDAVSIRKVM